MELIATDAQQLSKEPRVTLYEIDIRSTGQDAVLRFTPVVDGQESWPIQFGGNVYQRLSIVAEGFEWNGTGTAPRPTLTLLAKDLAFLSLVVNSNDLVGCPVRRIRTYRKYLDDGSSPDPSAHYPIDNFKVERKSKQVRKELTFELSTPLDQQGKKIPARQVLRDTCSHRFRYWANGQWNYQGVTCPYAGAAMYDQAGNPTTDPLKARCGKKISDCVVHFGEDAVLPMFAFPGVGRVS
jgi:lambda family phage minor tail protein L